MLVYKGDGNSKHKDDQTEDKEKVDQIFEDFDNHSDQCSSFKEYS